MEEAGRPGRARRRCGIGEDLDERFPARTERRDARGVAEHLEPYRLLVERTEAVGIAGAEPDGAEPRLSREQAHPRRARAPARRS